MNDEEFTRLKNDLSVNGFDSDLPITIYQGDILDGWNRYRACKELNIDPEYVEFEGSDIEAINFVMRTNKRRNLTSWQWACVAVKNEEIIQVIKDSAKERRGGDRGNQYTGGKMEKFPECQKQTSSETIADMFNTNEKYIREAEKLKKEKPEIYENSFKGKITYHKIKKEEKKEQFEKKKKKQKEDIQSGKIQMPEGVFEVVVIDPPWSYGREYDPDSSRVANPYPEMNQDELLKLNPPFADDCIIFLWTTHRFIWDAKELLDKWGFEYKANLVWDKEKIGMGAWLRMQCEFCLVGIKGKPIWNNTKWRDIIREPRREHSRKPDIFYEMVDEITIGRKLDFFSRAEREGWISYGNDTEKF